MEKKMDEVLKILEAIFEKESGEIGPETRFKEDLNANSLQRMMLLADLEDNLGKSLSYGKIHKCVTVQDLIELLK